MQARVRRQKGARITFGIFGELFKREELVEPRGIEPLTSAVRLQRSPI